MEFGWLLLFLVGWFFWPLIQLVCITALPIVGNFLWDCAYYSFIGVLHLPKLILLWLHRQTYYVHMFAFQLLGLVSLLAPLSVDVDAPSWLMLILSAASLVGLGYSASELYTLGEYRYRREAYYSEYLRKDYP